MKTTLTQASIATVTRLITNEFHNTSDNITGDIERLKLIETAKEYGLMELAKELTGLIY